MKHFFKKTSLILGLLTGFAAAPTALAADAADMPVIMSFKTNIYSYSGPENSFTIYLGSTEKDCEFYLEGPNTQEYIFVDPYTMGTTEEGERVVIATAVPLTVTERDNEIRIYGDATKIDYIDVHGCYLSEINLSPAMTNLLVTDFSHNELTEIDLTPFANIGVIDLTDNAFKDASKMKIGADHPYLDQLSVGINDVIDKDFDLRNYPQLRYFSARNNYGLMNLDPSNCPELVSLVLEVTNISELNVSKNLKLDVLNISNTKITNIDISKNTSLGEFYASHDGSYNNDEQYKLESVDVSHNPMLEYLDLAGNRISSIDLSNNPNLLLLYLQRNRLSDIDLSKQTRLAKLDLSNNYFTFATLPLPQEGWDYMYYRSPLPCEHKYKVNQPIDFSKDVIRAPYVDSNGNKVTPVTYAVVFAAPRTGEDYEIDEKLYTFKDGVITVKEAIADSVYVEFFCDVFPDWPIRSTNFMVKTDQDYDLPATAFTFRPKAAMQGNELAITLTGRPVYEGLELPADIMVRTNGTITTYENALDSVTVINNLRVNFPQGADLVEVFLNDGYTVSTLEMNDIKLESIDLSPSVDLVELTVRNAELDSIALGYNKYLRKLDLSHNNLKRLYLKAVRGDYEKFYLSDINVSDNQLSSIVATVYDSFKNLNLANNKFTDFEFKYYTGIETVDLSDNMLTGTIDISPIESLVKLDMSRNNIENFITGNLDNVTDMDLSYNNLNFATLPVITKSSVNYVYTPQNELKIIPRGASINLSSQNIQGKTEYDWYDADTKLALMPGLYTLEDGVTKFSVDLVGRKLYCRMTNPLFADFYSNPLTTTVIEVMDKPENVVATFTTVEDGEAQIGFRFAGEGSNSLYIDWSGEGNQYDEYLLENSGSPIYQSFRSQAGKTVKVYTYGQPSEVTMMFTLNIKMANLDATPMTKAQAFDIHGAGLTDNNIRLPESPDLFELVLDGNNFTNQTFPAYPSLSNLNLGGNNYSQIDLSPYPGLFMVQLASNSLSSVKFAQGTPIYQLDLTDNKISEIDLTPLTNLSELILSNNLLTAIDLKPVSRTLRVLDITGNRFHFNTLPREEEFTNPGFTNYYYANQKPMTVECTDGKVDMSHIANAEGYQTTYRWFLGNNQSDLYYDYEEEAFVGEELEGPEVSSDPEYSVENGVTSFHYTQPRKVICAMTNERFPKLILYTAPVAIDRSASVENISVDNNDMPRKYYNLQGIEVKTPSPGNVYIVRQGDRTEKVLFR